MKKFIVMVALSLIASHPVLANEETNANDLYSTQSQETMDELFDVSATDYNADLYRPGRPGPRPGRFVCYARNLRGQTFRAVGPNRQWAQQRAMNECYRFSRRCQPAGCQRF